MKQIKIDINCDLGESFGHFTVGNDTLMMELISSCNIACGFHGGDPSTIQSTLALAYSHNVHVGAHISYPDLMGFGRRSMNIPSADLIPIIHYQLSALQGMAEIQQLKVHHLKLHGALYNDANSSITISDSIIEAVLAWPYPLRLYCPANSILYQRAQINNIPVAAEAFIDRRYHSKGHLLPRNQANSVLKSIQESIVQLENIVLHNKVLSDSNQYISLKADTLCLHGDHSGAVELAKAVQTKLQEINCTMQPPDTL